MTNSKVPKLILAVWALNQCNATLHKDLPLTGIRWEMECEFSDDSGYIGDDVSRFYPSKNLFRFNKNIKDENYFITEVAYLLNEVYKYRKGMIKLNDIKEQLSGYRHMTEEPDRSRKESDSGILCCCS